MSIFQGGEVVRILVIGSGGREHALVWKLKQSPRVSEVFVAPGNGGTAREGAINVAVDAGDLDGLVELARKEKIDLVVPGPELPLTLGIVDAMNEAGIACFGPSAACARLDRMAELLRHGQPLPRQPGRLTTPVKPLFDKDSYCAMVERAKHYIREGDIFQVVLSNSLSAKMEGSLFDAYQILRRQNPSPYMFYFSSDDIEIAGASPETLVKLTDGKLFTYPLAGTRPRGKTPAEDAALEAGLLQDKKELSEHNMLVLSDPTLPKA